MNIQELTTKITKYLEGGRLRDALKLLRTATEVKMQWEVSDRLTAIEKNYAYMLGYLTNGAEDPHRDTIYNGLVTDTYAALDEFRRKLAAVDSPSLYFNTLRVRNLRPTNLKGLVDAFKTASGNADNLVEMLTSGKGKIDEGRRRDTEAAERDIFNYLWTAYPMTKADSETLMALIDDDVMPMRLKHLAASALVLGVLEYFDPVRLDTLISVYDNDDRDINLTSAALTGLLLGLFKYRNRPLPASLASRIKLLEDRKGWQADLKTAFQELIRTRDTERINRTMREDILPGMMKIRPDILKKISGTADPIDPETLEVNPEWEDMLRSSGLADKIRDLSELQQEGSDVFMSTFSHLKSFPFFNDVANWFLPFETEHTAIKGIGLPDGFADIVAAMPFLCDSDKYSFFLSFNSVPAAQRDMMVKQFEGQQGAQIQAMMEAGMQNPVAGRKEALSMFLQNLYRFLNLFNRKTEFYNPFNEGVNLLKVKALEPYFNDAETVNVVAEFFFKCSYYDDAVLAFTRLDSISEPQGIVFQKLGYCHHNLGNIDKAIEFYHQAELFDPDSHWLWQRLGSAYRAKGDFNQAAAYYKKLSDADPDNVSLALTLGYIYIQKGDNEEALRQFFKVEFLDEKGSRAIRPLAWTLFVTGDLDRSMDYYRKVLNDNPTKGDYLNMGHVALARRQYKEAINFYKLSMNGNDVEKLIASVRADSHHLNHAGVPDSIIALTIDALLYSMN